jgi:hypothetical protein
MGSLMPVGSGPDKEIVTLLNNLFSGSNLQALRDHHKTENLFDGTRRLHRVALRIGAYPARDYSPDDAKRKWFYFLHHLPTETADAIKKILRDTLKKDKTQIVAVRFSVEENPDATRAHLFPSNGEALSKYLIDGNKYQIHLVVPGQMSDDAEDPPDDQDGPPPETPIQWPTLRLRKATPKRRSR